LASQFSTAGINLDDSIDEALRKAGPFLEETRKLELEKLQAEISRIRQLASGTGTEETGVTAAVDKAANIIIDLENIDQVSPDSYWGIVNELADDMGITADKR